jgi:tRNA-specific 2-thiouridylase
MSGGVDSSVAALLLARSGMAVEGVTFDLFGERGEGSAAARAAKVCDLLSIPHHVVDAEPYLSRRVVAPFLSEYGAGRTPNPCVRCNERMKFPLLLREMERLGCASIATGHYAVVERRGDGWALLASPNREKDQSYFLYRLGPRVLSRLLLPVGALPKPEVRRLAADAGLPPATEGDSQDVCFLNGKGVAEFLEERGVRLPPGEIVDGEGRVVGRHGGIHRYTVGQRKGLGIASARPVYVSAIDAGRNRVVVASREESASAGAEVEKAVFSPGSGTGPMRGTARIRYRHAGVECLAEPAGDRLRVRFAAPQAGVAPGQSLVLYDGDRVVGGGIIRCPLA